MKEFEKQISLFDGSAPFKDDEDFEKASEVNSDSQLYKQAGNSIVVNCLYLIFKELM